MSRATGWGVARVGAETAVFRPRRRRRGAADAVLRQARAAARPRDAARGRAHTRHAARAADRRRAARRVARRRAARDRPPGFEHVPWVEYERLGEELAAAGICLGVFGRSEKAARVVPNKVYHAMCVGRPVITADTPAAREVLEDERTALLVPAGRRARAGRRNAPAGRGRRAPRAPGRGGGRAVPRGGRRARRGARVPGGGGAARGR